MRLGELKLTLKKISALNPIITPKPNGRMFILSNYAQIKDAFSGINQSKWFLDTHKIAERFLPSALDNDEEKSITANDKAAYEDFFNELHKKINLLLPILDELVVRQKANFINIKIPDNIKTSTELVGVLQETQDVLDKLLVNNGIRAEIKFRSFDVGSNWLVYEVSEAVIGAAPVVVAFLMGCAAIAQEAIAKKMDFLTRETGKAIHNYHSSKNHEETYEQVVDKVISTQIKKDAEKICSKFNINSNDNSQDFVNTTVLGINKMIAQFNKGAEYHPSLNPPKFLSEENGVPVINYEELGQFIETQNQSLISAPNPESE